MDVDAMTVVVNDMPHSAYREYLERVLKERRSSG